MEQGFYKYHDDTLTLVRAGKFVYGPGFELVVGDKDTYTYPVHGWYWFDTKPEALAFWGLNEDEILFQE